MPPKSPIKTNFKTYESATRLLAAVLATANPKLDFKAIASHVGKNITHDAINHRLRPIKQLAKMQAACVAKGEDPGELPIEKGEIQKLYGESTPDGLEWQFRNIKRLGKAQKEAAENGEDPSKLGVGGSGSGAGSGGGSVGCSTPGTGTGTPLFGDSLFTPSSKRKRATPTSTGNVYAKRYRLSAGYDDEDGDVDFKDIDYSAVDNSSPSLTCKRGSQLSAARAAARAAAAAAVPDDDVDDDGPAVKADYDAALGEDEV